MGRIEALQPQQLELGRMGEFQLQRPDTVIYAGSSQRRIALFQHIFSGGNLTNIPIGWEPEASVEEVTRFKIERALEEGARSNDCYAIIAADTRTSTPILRDGNGDVAYISRGKPKGIDEVQQTFISMLDVGEARNEPPHYEVHSASAMLHMNGKAHLVEDKKTCQVVLDPKKSTNLRTPEGFMDYLLAFTAFYSQPPYSSYAMEVHPEDLSGGISLPVLVKMGLVSSVDGVDVTSPYFRKALVEAVHVAAVGVSPDILKTVGVNEDAINNWTWLNGVVDSALS